MIDFDIYNKNYVSIFLHSRTKINAFTRSTLFIDMPSSSKVFGQTLSKDFK
jgi:hypothetical protein